MGGQCTQHCRYAATTLSHGLNSQGPQANIVTHGFNGVHHLRSEKPRHCHGSVGQLQQDDSTSPEILAALESDGEPAYELLACPGYLWLSALLLGLLPSDSPQPDVASWPFWRARCAFVWQLSIADASERGCGQCPSLFKASIADLIGEVGDTTSPLSSAGLLDSRARVELQKATAPLLRSYKRGNMPGTPQVGHTGWVG